MSCVLCGGGDGGGGGCETMMIVDRSSIWVGAVS
jgi:hypothetical protein